LESMHAIRSPNPAEFVFERRPALPVDLADVVEAVGSAHFGKALLNYLRTLCGADHCAVFLLEKDSVSEIATGSWDGSETAHRQALLYATQQHWRNDPMICDARQRVQQGRASIVRFKIEELLNNELRHLIYPKVRERVVICGRRADAIYGLSILRTEGQAVFADEALAHLSGVAETLLALIVKHTAVRLRTPRPEQALASLEEIESCMVAMTDFPRRELEVCARIVYGMSAAGIAIDLGIKPESIKTYRSRGYRRLVIGCERELLKWYLGLWGEWRGALYTRAQRSLELLN